MQWKPYEDEVPGRYITNVWKEQTVKRKKIYVVQTGKKIIQRTILMTSDPGDLVFDPTCGGGTTAYVAEQWGRRWVTCDTSRVALTLTRQRLAEAKFDFHKLAHPDEVDGLVITSRGPGTALDFALTLIETPKGSDVRDEVEAGLVRSQVGETAAA